MIDRAIADAGSRTRPRPARSGRRSIVKIVDQAPYLWLVNPRRFEFVSERVGNYQ